MKREHIVQIDGDKCVGCGLCRTDCPAGNILLKDKKALIIAQDCILCGHCVAICPQAAVHMTGFDEPPQEIAATAALNPQMLLDALRTRRSIRQFAKLPVENEVIERIIEAGRLTPTGGNAQDVSYIVLQDQMESCEKLAVRLFRRLLPLAKLANPLAKRTRIDDHFFFKSAPAAIAVLARNQVDGALAAANMALMAEACGLGVLYSGFFCMAANHSRALRKALGLARKDKVVATLVLGYPSVSYKRTAPKEPAFVRKY